MLNFKRISVTLVSSIDQVVSEIENHIAINQDSRTNMREKVADSKEIFSLTSIPHRI